MEICSAHYLIKGSEKSYTLKTNLFTSFNPLFPKYIYPKIPPFIELIITFHETNILGTHSGTDCFPPLAEAPLSPA